MILVVDDSPRIAELLGIWLSRAGYRVAYALDGKEAVEKARGLKPAAVTLDIMLPKKDGWEVIQELKRLPETKDIPVIIVSVIEDRELGFSLGAVDYLVKPVEKQELLKRLSGLNLPKANGPATVLIADDDPMVLDILASTLEPEGYSVMKAQGGKRAIELAMEQKPNLLILDLIMPDFSGFDVVQELRQHPETKDIPILIFTGKDITSEDKARLHDHIQAIAYKASFSPEGFIQEIKRLEQFLPSNGIHP